MGTIRKRVNDKGEVTWQVQIRRVGLPTQSATFDKHADAKKWEANVESELSRQQVAVQLPSENRLTDAIRRYKAEVLPEKPSSIRTQSQQLDWWDHQIGSKRLIDITPSVVNECKEALGKRKTRTGAQVTGATVNRYLAVLRHLFAVASKEWQWVETNPVVAVSPRRESKPRERYLDDDERIRLLEACRVSESPYLAQVVTIALWTGMRAREVETLRWGQVNFETLRITLTQTKNGKTRGVPIPAPVLDMLLGIVPDRPKPRALLFPSATGNGKSATVRTAWRTAVKRAGLEDFHFHDLRHTTGSYLAMSGATASEIAEVLGHSSLQMVKRYTHLSPEHSRAVLDRMVDKFSSQKAEPPEDEPERMRSQVQDSPEELPRAQSRSRGSRSRAAKEEPVTVVRRRRTR